MRVHQLLSGAGLHDVITAEARFFRGQMTGWGWDGGDYAARLAPGLGGAIQPLSRFRAAPGDVLLIHHSAAMPQLEEILALENPIAALYHNITPPELLWEHAPVVAGHCEIGLQQLPWLAARADVLAADSAFNGRELSAEREVTVVPLPIDPVRLGAPSGGTGAPANVLFVGRLSPHKRQAELIRVFSALRRARLPAARLTLVGDPITPDYARALQSLGDELAPGAVSVESGLSQSELADRYRNAGVFCCLSAHEGFCVPVAEAFHFGVPVIAAPNAALPEVIGDAGLLVEDQDPAVLAELLRLTLTDAELRAELIRRGQARVRTFSPERSAAALRTVLERAAAR